MNESNATTIIHNNRVLNIVKLNCWVYHVRSSRNAVVLNMYASNTYDNQLIEYLFFCLTKFSVLNYYQNDFIFQFCYFLPGWLLNTKIIFTKRAPVDKRWMKPWRTGGLWRGIVVCMDWAGSRSATFPLDFKRPASINMAQCVRNKQPTLVMISASHQTPSTHTNTHTHSVPPPPLFLFHFPGSLFFSPTLSPTPSPLPSFHIKH